MPGSLPDLHPKDSARLTATAGRANPAAMAIVPDLGERLTLRVDPHWPHITLWNNLRGNTIGDKLKFTFVDFEEGIQEAAPANYSPQDVIGRAESYQTYVGQQTREITLTFKFRVQGEKFSDLIAAIQQEVLFPVRWLDALQHPIIDPSSQLSHAPPPLLLTIGRNILPLFVGRVIMIGAAITWQPPFEPRLLIPHGADVACIFRVVRSQIKNHPFIFADFR